MHVRPACGLATNVTVPEKPFTGVTVMVDEPELAGEPELVARTLTGVLREIV